MRAIRFTQTGGPEVLKLETVPLPELRSHEVQIRHVAIGVNYIDTYHRSGLYPVPLPSGIGVEAAGVIEALGRDVQGFSIGDHVAYAGSPIGSYAEFAQVPANRLVPIPAEICFEQAAASLLKGMTAEFLFDRCAPTRAGDWVLIHAAAGGVGQILTQWAHQAGARIIATTGSKSKEGLLESLGAEHVINTSDPLFSGKVRELTDGRGVKVVFDGVGKSTFDQSLACLESRGCMVIYGNASGAVPPVDPLKLSRMGSLFLTRPTLNDYTASTAELRASATKLFDHLINNRIRISIGQTFPLSAAAEVHRLLEARETVGSTLLLP